MSRYRERRRTRSRERDGDRHRESTRDKGLEDNGRRSRERYDGSRDSRDREDSYQDRRSVYHSRSPDRDWDGDDRYYARFEDEDEWERRERRKERRGPDYARQLERGLDDSPEDSPSAGHRWHGSQRHRSFRSLRDQPSSTLHIRGIPENKDESDLHRLFGEWAGVSEIRVSRDRLTGRPRGFAFVEFESVEAAEDVMDREGRYLDLEDGSELVIEFSHNHPPSGGQASQGMDWICGRCQATNFARRSECHQCSSARSRDAQLVSSEADGPSQVLKVSNLDPSISEEALRYHISPQAPIKEVRLITDRQLGASKGYAFVHFHSVADASKVLHALQDSLMDGQSRPLRFVFARDRAASRPQASAAASNALEAAQLMSGYSGWAPAVFDESAPVGKASNGSEVRDSQGKGQPQSDGGGTNDSEFQYDSTSGYYFHAASGFYYDANSSLYFDSADQRWKRRDPETGQYQAVEGQGGGPSSAAQAAIAATTAAVENLQAPELQYRAPAEGRRRGAVIGSAAKLNPEGVLAAAKEAEAREEARRKQEEKAAKMAARKQGRKGAPPASNPQQPAPSATPLQGVIRSSGKWGVQRGANPA